MFGWFKRKPVTHGSHMDFGFAIPETHQAVRVVKVHWVNVYRRHCRIGKVTIKRP